MYMSFVRTIMVRRYVGHASQKPGNFCHKKHNVNNSYARDNWSVLQDIFKVST